MTNGTESEPVDPWEVLEKIAKRRPNSYRAAAMFYLCRWEAQGALRARPGKPQVK